MTTPADKWSSFAYRSIDLLLISQPKRTGLGAVTGLVIGFVANLFRPALTRLLPIDLAGAPVWGWAALGILLVHLPTIFALRRASRTGNESIDQAIGLIELANFTDSEKRRHYRELTAKLIGAIKLTEDASPEIMSARKRLKQRSKEASMKEGK